MARTIGIRREDKNAWERRVPLCPEHVAELVAAGHRVRVQPSTIRVFGDEAYRQAGAELGEDLSGCELVLAVKEIPTALLEPGGHYLFFAHVIKGQPHNMPLLRALLDRGCTLIDYEKMVDAEGKRLVAFGRHAGLAGMIDSLWALGRRLEVEGLRTPLLELGQAHGYPDLQAALAAVDRAGEAMAGSELPAALRPLVVGFAGYGNVSGGAQQVFDRLPHAAVEPSELPSLRPSAVGAPFVKAVFEERHMVVPRAPGGSFALQDYYRHPERYRGVFARYLPHLHLLLNCTYWAPAYPRLVSRDALWGLYGAGHQPALRVIGDISCDIEGGVECTLRATEPDAPTYVYAPADDAIAPGFTGHGPVVLAVDNLPCELPADASRAFGDALVGLIAPLAQADLDRPFAELELPAELRGAVIAHQGELAPDYRYLAEHLARAGA